MRAMIFDVFEDNMQGFLDSHCSAQFAGNIYYPLYDGLYFIGHSSLASFHEIIKPILDEMSRFEYSLQNRHT